MTSFFQRLASMKLALALFVTLLVAMAAGTIIESFNDSQAALEKVYLAWWFMLLELFFALSVLSAVIANWPWGARRTGFAITHCAVLLILAGALVSGFFKTEGQLQIREGESSDELVIPPTKNDHEKLFKLPFAVKLNKFEIDMYPGTTKHAMYRSRVVVEDKAGATNFPAIIEMNRELKYRGWRLFQSSYQLAEDGNMTVLSVSSDPGQPVVFSGYILLLIGMIFTLFIRISQARSSRSPQYQDVNPRAGNQALVAVFILAALTAGQVQAAPVPDTKTSETLKGLPVQHDGRAMPLDTLAREAVWNVTGMRSWKGIDPTAQVLGWVFNSDEWLNEPIVKIGNADLVSDAGFPKGTTHASFSALTRNRRIMELFQQSRDEAEQMPRRKPSKLIAAASRLEDRLYWMDSFFKTGVLRVLPHPTDPKGTWTSPDNLQTPDDLLVILGQPLKAASYPEKAAIERELTYNRVRPTRIAWSMLAIAAMLSILAMSFRKRWLDAVSLLGLAGGWGVLTWGIGMRWLIAGRIPAANMYESLLFLGWGVGFFALIAMVVLRNRLVVLNAAIMSALTIALTDLLPIDWFIHPVQPVLANTAWLAIHVPIIMISYSVLALGVLFAHMQIGMEIFAPNRRDLIAKMNDFLYWYIHVGAILLVAGIITGSMWGASSWGRYWGWDPKEVWSLVAFLAYVALLHARLKAYIGSFGVAVISIGAFWTILMTYLGVNYVLASGMHSYGFGGSSIVNGMVAVAAVEVVFLLAGCIAVRRNR